MDKMGQAIGTIRSVRSKADGCIVFCSYGKDSLVLLDMVYPVFERVVCVFMYFVPGLEHIARWTRWAKVRYPKAEFAEVPHWSLSYIMRSGVYCVADPRVRLMKFSDVVRAVRLKYGLHYVFTGMKKADSMNRRLMLMAYRDTVHRGIAYPLAEWTQKDALAYLRQHRLPAPVRYSLQASGGVGFNLQCMLWMRDNFPDDLERIYRTFPLSRRMLWEYDNKNKDKDDGTGTDSAGT